MSKEESKIISVICSKTALTVVLFLLGIGAYVWGYYIDDRTSLLREILIKVGDVLVIGVVIGFIANAAQFLRLFKMELQNVVYGKEFIGKQKDVSDIWETISKQLFKNKFPRIHSDFLKVIKSYFPNNEVSYYNDYEAHIIIEWHNSCNNLIKVLESVSFELVAESEDKFLYPLKNWTHVKDEEAYENKIISFMVNGKTPKTTQSKVYKDGEDKCVEEIVELKGSKTYKVEYTRAKIYNIYDDHYLGFRAKYIVKDLRVYLECPDDIDAQFICRGTTEDFSDITKGLSTNNRIGKRYCGIILPRQGYIFALQKK